MLNFLGDFVPPPITLTGTLVEPVPGGGERPAKGRVVVAPDGTGASRANTDDAGRFTVRRPVDDVGLFAYGGAAGASQVAAVKVAVGTNEVKVVLGPPATASGRVVDASGKALVGEGPRMSLLGGPDGLPGLRSTMFRSKFEPGGRYEFKGLIPGVEYRVFLLLYRDSGVLDNLPIKTFRVDRPGPIDLGEFVVPDAKP